MSVPGLPRINLTASLIVIPFTFVSSSLMMRSPDLSPAFQAGVSSIKLEDGSSVEVSPYYYAKIPEDKKGEAFDWLRQNNFGDLIKNNVSVSFGKGEDSNAAELKAILEAKGLVVDQKQDIHWQTLRGFVREQMEKNQNIPSEMFGLYVANRTKIKMNK